jgi:Hydrophobic abundant protein (HAP)
MTGILITTSGILFLVVGLIGASIEVYAQLALELLQQQVSRIIQQQLPAMFQEGGEATAREDQGLLFDPAEVLRSLVENLLASPLWLTLTLVGIGLIYLGLYITQRQIPRRRI